MIVKTKTSPVIVINPDSDDRSFYRVTKNVIRIGSDPRSDIKFAESLVSRHAVTIEQRDDELIIHNKAGYQLLLGEEPIPPEYHITWHDQGRLRLNDKLELLLLKNPQRKNKSIESDSHDQLQPDQESDDNAESKSRLRVIVLSSLIAILAIPALLMDGPSGNPKARQQAEQLEKLLTSANNAVINDPLKPRIAEQLQRASRREFRDNIKSAESLTQMRNLIDSLRDKDKKLPDPWYDDARSYILEKLKES